jgi:hypothetical protein
LDIFLRGFSISICPEQSLKVLLLRYLTCLLKYVLDCEQNFFIFPYGLSDIQINCICTSQQKVLCIWIRSQDGRVQWKHLPETVDLCSISPINNLC